MATADKIYIEGRSPKPDTWEPMEAYYKEFEHPLWKALGEKALQSRRARRRRLAGNAPPDQGVADGHASGHGRLRRRHLELHHGIEREVGRQQEQPDGLPRFHARSLEDGSADGHHRWKRRRGKMTNVRLGRFFVAVPLALLAALQAVADTLAGKVVRIADSDTLTVLVDREQIKVRLEGIDAPEKGQPYGDKAKQERGRLVFGKSVKVETKGKDQCGRTLGRVFIGDVDVNAHLVRQGFQPFFRDPNIMYHHWNEVPHRFGLFGLNQEVRPQYFVFQLLGKLGSRRLHAACDAPTSASWPGSQDADSDAELIKAARAIGFTVVDA